MGSVSWNHLIVSDSLGISFSSGHIHTIIHLVLYLPVACLDYINYFSFPPLLTVVLCSWYTIRKHSWKKIMRMEEESESES